MVVGAGNSAVQVAAEPAQVARVGLAGRAPVRFFPQRPLGRDLHFWLTLTGLDAAPPGRFRRHSVTMAVVDDGRHRTALAVGRPERRPMFTAVDGPVVTRAESTTEKVDTIILAAGYLPDLNFSPRSAPSTGRAVHCTGRVLRMPMPAWRTSGWNGSAACRRHPCGASGVTRGVRPAGSPGNCAAGNPADLLRHVST
ncbi:hypothetical protein ACIGW0_09960 [Streptomyces bikiniensis]|uniref:Uncharacterized protein n=1 Tax=Streptomyces bikiniensis TaxID=1896 RepID=A0ABW8CQ58_STRBI